MQHEAWSVFGGMLVEWLLRGAPVFVAVLLIALATRRRHPVAAYRVMIGGVAAIGVLPLLALTLPPLPILPSAADTAADATEPPPPAPIAPELLLPPATEGTQPAWSEDLFDTLPVEDEPNLVADVADQSFAPVVTVWHVVIAAWFTGLLFLLAAGGIGWWRLRRIVRRAHPADAADHQQLQQLAAELGLRREVQLLCSSDTEVPLVAGIRSPVLLLPADHTEWSASQRRLVMLHELMHIRRGDLRWHAAISLVCALHWPNPLAWLTRRCVRSTREQSCDALVVQHGESASEYAAMLLHLAARLSNRPPRLPALAMSRCDLLRRVPWLLEPGSNRRPPRPLMLLPLLPVLLAVVSAAAAPTATQEPREQARAGEASEPESGEAESGAGHFVSAAPKAKPAPDRAIDHATAMKVIAERLNAQYEVIKTYHYRATETLEENDVLRWTAEWECWRHGSNQAMSVERQFHGDGTFVSERYLHSREALVVVKTFQGHRGELTRYELENGKGSDATEIKRNACRGPTPLWYATSLYVAGPDRLPNIDEQAVQWELEGDINGQKPITLRFRGEGQIRTELVIDPARGFLIVERITHVGGKKHVVTLSLDRVGEQWFPVKMVSTSERHDIEVTLACRDVKINEPPPWERFQMSSFFEMQDGIPCQTFSVDGKRRLEVWLDGALIDSAVDLRILRQRRGQAVELPVNGGIVAQSRHLGEGKLEPPRTKGRVGQLPQGNASVALATAREDEPPAPPAPKEPMDNASAMKIVAERLNARYEAIRTYHYKATETLKEGGELRWTAQWECWRDGPYRALTVKREMVDGSLLSERYLHTPEALVAVRSLGAPSRIITRYELKDGKSEIQRTETRRSLYRGPTPWRYATSLYVYGPDHVPNLEKYAAEWEVDGDINGQKPFTIRHRLEGRIATDLVIDPAQGFLIVERVVHVPGAKRVMKLSHERIGDRWFPTSIVETSEDRDLLVTLECRDVQVNQVLPADNFQMSTFFKLQDGDSCLVVTLHDERKVFRWLDGSLTDSRKALLTLRERAGVSD